MRGLYDIEKQIKGERKQSRMEASAVVFLMIWATSRFPFFFASFASFTSCFDSQKTTPRHDLAFPLVLLLLLEFLFLWWGMGNGEKGVESEFAQGFVGYTYTCPLHA
jgi:hypothetical protein